MSIFIEILATKHILRTWKENPGAPRREYQGISWFTENTPKNEHALSTEDVRRYRDFLTRHSPSDNLINEINLLLENQSDNKT